MVISTQAISAVFANKAANSKMLSAATKIPEDTIKRFRDGDIRLEDITIGEAISIYENVIGNGEYFSLDYYEQILPEFMDDYRNQVIGDTCFVVRGELIEAMNYRPIIDWYNNPIEAFEDNNIVERISSQSVIKEMKRLSRRI